MLNNRASVQLPDKWQLFVKHLHSFHTAVYLTSNQDSGTNLLAISLTKPEIASTIEELRQLELQGDWVFGFVSFDLKNSIFRLSSANKSLHDLSDLLFFSPDIVVEWKEGSPGFAHYLTNQLTESKTLEIVSQLSIPTKGGKVKSINFLPRISKEEYLTRIEEILDEIQYGNIYEANYCQEFYSNEEINPYAVYEELNRISPTPFSAFVKSDSFYLMCASPERYFRTKGSTIVSEPIKGTIKRGSDFQEDQKLTQQLINSKKDRKENVMIVDLVRNDLSRIAAPKSVQVDELFEIYTFPQVHQMISKISAQLKPEVGLAEILENTFPMGSMTGAPKKKALEIIDEKESFGRGLFSGSVGFIRPNGDMDFNVIIRSILYSSQTPIVSFGVGGAITIDSGPLQEYEESLLKAKAIFQVFESKTS